MTKTTKRLVILDTHAILHRAYHALPDFSSSKGKPTGALYGLISMLVKIINDLKPDYIAAAVDLAGPTYRHAAFKDYKGKRVKTEDALVEQIKETPRVLKTLGIPVYSSEGFEADDVIGTIVEKLKKKNNLELIIASGDMDTLQLVDDQRVRVFTLKKGLSDTILYDERAVLERFGFGPQAIPDYKGLRGDPSDNIPGVKGVGDKTATALITAFGTIEELYTTIAKDPEKVLAAGCKEGMLQKIKEQEEEARFSKMLAEIRRDVPVEFALPDKPWVEHAHPHEVLSMLSEFDFRSLIPRVTKLFGTPALFQPETKEPSEEVDAQEFAEVSLAVSVLDSNIAVPTLDDMYYLGKSNEFGKAKEHILKEIEDRKLQYVYEKIELPLMPVLRRMEKRGVLIDKAFLQKLSVQYHHELEKIGKRIYKAAGGEFNINSPKQLGDVLFDTLQLATKNQKKTAGGQRSTRESELVKMKSLHPIIDEILAHRELQKLLSTYIDTLPTLLDSDDRLHTTFIQIGAATGRLASQNPNLQNIPIKSELGRAIRHAFVAKRGSVLVAFDYSQIELRIAAFLSGDEALAEIFKRGRDVHTEVAARVFGVKESAVLPEMRRRAKVINFGILYGMGVSSLQQALGTTRAEAQKFYNDYFEAFPRLAAYIEEVKADAARRGYTETHFGRRRYFEGIKSPIPYVRASAERMAINAPLQGTQADLVKLAMIEIDALFEKEGLRDKAHLLLQVHDELVFEIEEPLVEKLSLKIKEKMEHIVPDKERKGIPFIAEGKVGKNWGEMEKI
ncbi:MAG: DNA polymerase [Patescibacteria group bacterium]